MKLVFKILSSQLFLYNKTKQTKRNRFVRIKKKWKEKC